MHHHSTFSYGDGYALPEAHVRRAVELNMSAITLTEHGNMSSHVKLEAAAQKAGIKPIFGVETYCGEIDEEHREQKKNHLTLLAEDEGGYANLLTLVSESYSKGFYYEPTVDGQMLYDRREGLVVLSGCQGSLLCTSLVGGKLVDPEYASYGRGLKIAERFSQAFPGAYYLEVQAFPELESTCALNPMIERIARKLRLPLVATLDIHYTAPTESEIQKILHNVRPGEKRTLEDMERDWGYEAPLCLPLSDRVIYRRLRQTGLSHRAAVQAILNAEELAQRCNVELPKLPDIEFPLPPGYTSARELMREWVNDGWVYRGIHRLPPSKRRAYQEQLDKEMAIIESKNYENYFLVVADGVVWCKEHGVFVGPARGSAAASLVAFLLRITEVNPLVHTNLVFERFIDESRPDLPDIDIDLDADTRWRLREYLAGKYGECFNVGTFVYYKSRNALDDVARVFRVPKWEVDVIKGQLIERSSGDLRSSATIEDTVEQFPESKKIIEKYPDLRRAQDLEGNIKGFGVHAAGLVVGHVRTVAPVIKRVIKGREVEVVAIDKWDAERQGLLKMDYLGLKAMTMINNARLELGLTMDDLYNLPLDDEPMIEIFRKGDVIGIFQFEGQAVRLLNSQIKPDNFDEICDVTSLARPGPLHNGAAEAYMNIKAGTGSPELWHPAVDRIVQDTKYQIIYQEQILRIVREIGNFDWTAAAYIRKIISKKLGDQEFNRQKSRFMEGAATIHERHPDMPPLPVSVAERVWGSCITSGSYAFNFAHACGYGKISCITAWLKAHHEAVFFACNLAAHDDDWRRNTLIRDAIRHGVEVRPPSVRRSTRTWTMVRSNGGRPAVRMGFQQLPGIGEKMADRVMEVRGERGKEHGWVNWHDMITVPGIGPAKLQAITDFVERDDPFGVFDADRRIEEAKEALWKFHIPRPTHRSIDVPYERGKQVAVTWMGVVRQRNLRDLFEVNARMGKEIDPEKIKDPDLSEFMLLVCEDEEDMMRLRIDRYKYPNFKEALWNLELDEDVVWVQGFKPSYRSAREIVVTRLVVIEVGDRRDEAEDEES
jgi:DNA polymerase-3 subunit alpha